LILTIRKENPYRGTTPPLFWSKTANCLDNGDDVEEIATHDQTVTFGILIPDNINAAGDKNGES
jgi:hypothetical protein